MKRAGAAVASLSLAALSLAGCATTERISAAPDVHALMVAIRDDDRAAFDAHVDRPALEGEIQALILRRAAAPDAPPAVKAAALLLSGPMAGVAGDVFIRPSVFRAVAEYYGYRPGQPLPGDFAIAEMLRGLPGGQVCAARRHGGCLVTFADEDGVWRMVGFDGDLAMLRLEHRAF